MAMKIKDSIISWSHKVSKILRRNDPFDIKMYAHMFLEDVYLGILPYDDHNKPSFTVKLNGGSQDSEFELCEAIERHSRRDLKEGFTDFVRETAKGLAYDGKVYYRILYTNEEQSRFDLIRLYREDVWSFLGYHFVFKKDRRPRGKKESHRWGQTVCFRLPPEYKGLPFLVRKMSKIDPTGLPEFALDQYHPESPKSLRIPVDFNVVKNSEEYRLGRLTRSIGWTGRRLLSERMTEYYYLHRELIYKEFLIKLREGITRDLNKVLGYISHEIDFPSAIVLEGLPSLDEISKSRELLSTGSATFAEVMKPFRLKPATS
jgi:hypothetical protein